MFDTSLYYGIVAGMICLAVIVFFALGRITPGYGMMYSKEWGPTLPNRIGWIVMEAPAFIAMLLLWVLSPRADDPAPAVMGALFEIHYFQRSFIFPLLIRGRNRMPLSIIACGVIFNILNAYMIGGWIFWVSPAQAYPASWLWSPLFILGTVIFLAGMAINLHSDWIIRHLRKPGDSGHYIPRGGMFKYVTSANYLGELTEWIGFAILTWSLGALAFAVWTFANLAPRARKIHGRYIAEFGDEYKRLQRRFIIPFIY